MEITIYCPDENFKFHGNLLKEVGVGGGKTALICLAKALSKFGHNVFVCGNVKEGVYNGVRYISKDKVNSLKTDVLLVTTSHKFDISELKYKEIKTNLLFLWLHNNILIRGMDEFEWDGIICVSHFVKNQLINLSNLPNEIFFVIHNGFDKSHFKPWYKLIKRNPYGIVFASHPSKGLDNVVRLLNDLRKDISPDFYLDIYGGYKLWGSDQPEMNISLENVSYKGNIPQAKLVKNLFSYNFMIKLYDFQEPFGIIYAQALRAGVICIVSNVGGISETIRNGYNGFLIDKPCNSESVLQDVKNLISYLLKNKHYLNYIRKNAMKYDRGWDDVAKDFLNLFHVKAIKKSVKIFL